MNKMPGCSGDRLPISQRSYVEVLTSTAKALSMPPSDKEKALACLRDRPGVLASGDLSRFMAGCGAALQSLLCAGSGQ